MEQDFSRTYSAYGRISLRIRATVRILKFNDKPLCNRPKDKQAGREVNN